MAHLTDQKRAHYIHDVNSIGLASDSMGESSKAAMYFTNHFFAKGPDDLKRRWDSKIMRVVLNKQFSDQQSSVLCLHRVRDFIYLGIPNSRLERAQRPRDRANNLQVAHDEPPGQQPVPLEPAAMPLGGGVHTIRRSVVARI